MPIIISDGMVASETVALSLQHPRILWDDIMRRRVSLTASSEAAGFEAVNATDYFTYDFWRPTALPATLEVQLAEAEEIDYALIAAHTLGDAAAAVKVQYYDAGWQDATIEVLPGNNRVLAYLFDTAFSNRFRLSLAGSTIPSIGVFMLGKALAVERKIYQGHTPITLAKQTAIRPQSSEGGEWLGRSVRREGVATDIAFANLTAAWVRDKLDPFIIAAKTYPFGWAWRPADYPAEVAYVWVPGGDIKPVNTGPRDLMSVSFAVEGHIE